MGFTRYWDIKTKISDAEFAEFSKEAEQLVEEIGGAPKTLWSLLTL